MVVDMRFSAMLLLNVPVRDVYVLDTCVVVGVAVSGEQMPPVLALMQVVSYVKMLVTVLDGLMLMTPRLHHQLPLPSAERTIRSTVHRLSRKRGGPKSAGASPLRAATYASRLAGHRDPTTVRTPGRIAPS